MVGIMLSLVSLWLFLVGPQSTAWFVPSTQIVDFCPYSEAEAERQLLPHLQPGKTLTLRIDEDCVNGLIRKHWERIQREVQQQGVRLQNLRVDFKDGRVLIYATLDWMLTLTWTADITPYIHQGVPQIQVNALRIGWIPVPSFLWREIVEEINAEMRKDFQNANAIQIHDLQVTEQHFLATLTVKAR